MKGVVTAGLTMLPRTLRATLQGHTPEMVYVLGFYCAGEDDLEDSWLVIHDSGGSSFEPSGILRFIDNGWEA